MGKRHLFQIEISIPYGSIKSGIPDAFNGRFLFQFLMVRLKAVGKTNHLAEFHISIPYGSIKRSIQTGNRDRTRQFQFLMVRLKG